MRHPAFLSLAFALGEAAQVDWGYAGTITLGSTRAPVVFSSWSSATAAWPRKINRLEIQDLFRPQFVHDKANNSKAPSKPNCAATPTRPCQRSTRLATCPSTITAAVLDRLLHHGQVVVLEGTSYCMKDRIES